MPALRCDFANVPLLANGARSVQAKLDVSQPGDPHEREADQTADQVMRMTTPAAERASTCCGAPSAGLVSRKCGACATEEEAAPHDAGPDQQDDGGAGIAIDGDMPLPDENAATADDQTQALSPAVSSAQSGESVSALIPDSGRHLDRAARDFLEPRFGFSFEGVRVHTGSSAAAAARSLDARAYTVGTNVVFGDSQYAPHTSDGLRLIAHELTHVVQQNPSMSQPRSGGPAFGLSPSGPIVQRWKTGGVAPTGTNTIVCDGSGGIRIQTGGTGDAAQTACLGNCIRQHEGSHRDDALASKADVCAGAANGTQVTFSDVPEQKASEIKASDVEIACLRAQRPTASAACQTMIDTRITQMIAYRDSFK
ncbi:MAG: hypothetical protein QOJ39_243 [Candidatus Eremiobacteraeota bacterium]|nr:hypothetical protein [Candidatus Eremiobacteraeota bacterium]